MSCIEKFGDTVESAIGGVFRRLGQQVGSRPRLVILLAIVVTILCGGGFTQWTTENRADKLWVPQGTTAQEETTRYEQYFDSTVRFNTMTATAKQGDVLEKELLVEVMKMHTEIATTVSYVDGMAYTLPDLCSKAGGSCATESGTAVCRCFITSILRQWNYDLETLQADDDVLATVNEYGSQADLEAVLGNPVFDQDGQLLSAEALTLSYFLEDRAVLENGEEVDPVNEGWELVAFVSIAKAARADPDLGLTVDFFSARSFGDEFGEAITGDLSLVNISYVMAFMFLGATLGNIKCGTGSRWTMALAALVVVIFSTAAGFGVSSAVGLFYGPVHSLLPFVLLGIGVDDAFVIVNAFNRERKGSRASESNEGLAKRAATSLARAGASITVTSLTDLVAFAISASSSIPALASFCGYAAICIFFLWMFASTFFSACMVLDERRQRDNRRECLCCLTRKKTDEEDEDEFKEDVISRYFRNYHAPAILSPAGKVITLVLFAGLIGYGSYGVVKLPVEDTERNFIPAGSYVLDYFDTSDKYFPSQGIDLAITFEDGSDIYEKRDALAELDTRLTGLTNAPPYLSEPASEETYQNMMAGLAAYLSSEGATALGNVTVGEDNWPTTEADFFSVVNAYASPTGPGSVYAQDVSFSEDGTDLRAYRVHSKFVGLTKNSRGRVIDDADRQIEAMDEVRVLINSWDDLPSAFPYAEKFISIEGFKVIRRELFTNVGLAIAAVAVIVFFTVASPVTSLLITLVVACCILEILGFMYALGIVIDTVSVIHIVLAVGLSVDYSAHVGHCFMVKGGADKNERALEALADVGAAVLNGAISTFLAVVVLLFSSSYVFNTLSKLFALTIVLGTIHGLVILPVLLSLLGPKPFVSASHGDNNTKLGATAHQSANESSDDDKNSSGN